MVSVNFTEDDFNKKILEFFNISQTLNDNWKIFEKNEKFYLSKKQLINVKRNVEQINDCSDSSVAIQHTNDEILSIEYHILFHPSYQVPALYFNCYTGKNVKTLKSSLHAKFVCNTFNDYKEKRTCTP
jgi:Autophagocytosis associated protein, active-site domain